MSNEKPKKKKDSEKKRLERTDLKVFLFMTLVFFAGAFLIYNVLLLSITGRHSLSGTYIYDGQKDITTRTLVARRGNIYDSRGSVLAQDVKVYDILIRITKRGYEEDTDYVTDFEGTAKKLSEILGCKPADILKFILLDDRDEVEIGDIGRNLSQQTYDDIMALKLPGISFTSHLQRYYPYSNYACHFIGFASYIRDDERIRGIMGIENSLDEYLSGTDGHYTYYRSSGGTPLLGGDIEYVNAVDGNDIYLTLNATIQSSLENTLSQIMALKKTKVDKCWGIVMDPQTGKILGYGSYPNFDQNTRDNIVDYNDYCSTLPYEPGSVMKSFIYAACIDTGNFDGYQKFNANPFPIGIDSNGDVIRAKSRPVVTINNFAYARPGMVTFRDAYAHSYNSGVLTLLAEHIDDDEYVRYLDNFGFFKFVDSFGIEEGNDPGNRNVVNPVERATTTYGQGSSVTALQMVQAYSAICNDGVMVKPYIIDKIVDHNTNEIIYSASTTVVGQPIKAETAAQMLDLMKYAVDSYATVYKMKGIGVGGKTGTADVATSRGYDGTTIHSIMLTVPTDDPKAIIYVCYQDHHSDHAYFSGYVRETLETVASVLNLYDTEKDDEITTKTVYENGAPVLINHTLDYARSKANSLKCNLVVIGNGQSVIRQYPAPQTTIVSGQNIMVLLNDDGISMPDMTGWSRKDVTAFWDLTGIAIEIDGFGYVFSQNIPPGQLIDTSSEIKVSLR